MTGSCSGWEKLFARGLGTGGAGAPGIDGGTIWSGSKKYMHLGNGVRCRQYGGRRARQTNARSGRRTEPCVPESEEQSAKDGRGRASAHIVNAVEEALVDMP